MLTLPKPSNTAQGPKNNHRERNSVVRLNRKMINRPIFVNDGIYHIYNRGVEKRNIFLETRDYIRFSQNLEEFNDPKPTPDLRWNINRERNSDDREHLVALYAYVLMPNHYHIILKQLTDGGIEKYMRKIGVGYAMYFNKRRDRVGPLFQGRFKAQIVEEDEYFLHLTRYIHLNPLKLYQSDWHENGIKDRKASQQFLYNYRWSSYLQYIGKTTDNIITPGYKDLFSLHEKEYKKFVEEFPRFIQP